MAEIDTNAPRYELARDSLGYFTRDTHDDNRAVRDAAGNVMYCPSVDAVEWVAEQNRYHERQMQRALNSVFRSAF